MKADFSYEEVAARVEPQVVHVENSEALKLLIRRDRRNFRALARALREEHRKRYGEPLKISENSLTCELAVHYRLERFVKKLPEKLRENAFCRRALRATAVIDCGDRASDGNRLVWDLLSPLFALHRKGTKSPKV